MACLKFTDVTIRIKYDKIEGKQHILETINATVSHEMRNPINSILSQNIKIEHCLNMLEAILEEDISIQEMKTKVNELIQTLKKSNKVQQSSTKLLNHTVNDLLTFAQINGGKFRKNLSNFNI